MAPNNPILSEVPLPFDNHSNSLRDQDVGNVKTLQNNLISINSSLEDLHHPNPISFHLGSTRPLASHVYMHPVIDTIADQKMTRVIKDSSNGPIGAQSVKIHGGSKEGFKIHLNGPSGQDNKTSIQGPKGHNYVITPAGATVGENIAINGGGLYIRAKQNKKQLITATSCPDNQVQVQVGQGKSAVQLSIQVAPQGRRGEVELNCVRSEIENGGTGYTVNVNREADEGRICPNKLKQNSISHGPTMAESSPRSKSPSSHVAQCQSSQSHVYIPHLYNTPTHQVQRHQDHTCDMDCNFESKACIAKESFKDKECLAERRHEVIGHEQYATREIYEKECMQNASLAHSANKKYSTDG